MFQQTFNFPNGRQPHSRRRTPLRTKHKKTRKQFVLKIVHARDVPAGESPYRRWRAYTEAQAKEFVRRDINFRLRRAPTAFIEMICAGTS